MARENWSSRGGDAAPWLVLGLVCLAVVLSMTTWFSATAIAPELIAHWNLSPSAASWLTNGVQVGFVIGAVAASIVNLPDIVPLNRLMAASAALAAAANVALLFEPNTALLILARVVVGIALAGVYPPALKLIATWFSARRGIALGAVIAALTIGSSLPHLLRSLTASFDWQNVVIASSALTLAGAFVFLFAAIEGPYPFSKARFNPRQIGVVIRQRPFVLVTIGYLGHMWELYAVWAWLLLFTQAYLANNPSVDPGAASIITFTAIAIGAVGCLLGGFLSDRIGRAKTAAGMMVVSGTCAFLAGFAFAGPVWIFVFILLIWGISIIGDSAQFSAATTEVSDPAYVGTALSMQLGLGFAMTIAAIWLLPQLAEVLGSWRWVFMAVVPGPIIGTIAMIRFQTLTPKTGS